MRIDMVIDPFDIDAATAVDAAVAAEAAGFDGVWTYDHLSGAVLDAASSLDVWTLLGAIAAVTRTVTVGPLVANVTTRHPAVTAVAAGTLAQLAPGRVIVGLGAGAGSGSRFAVELDMLGIATRSAGERRQMVADATGLMRAIWKGSDTYSGGHFTLTQARGFGTVDPPPIVLGCNGPKMAEVAGTSADGANFHSSQDNLEELVDVALAAAKSPDFEISVEAPQTCDWGDWLRAGGPERSRLEAMGVARIMVVWHTRDGVQAIAEAAPMLRGRS